jgi:hypothetical protein
LLAAFRTGGGRGRFEYAAASINVNETAAKYHAGAALPRRKVIFGEQSAARMWRCKIDAWS